MGMDEKNMQEQVRYMNVSKTGRIISYVLLFLTYMFTASVFGYIGFLFGRATVISESEREAPVKQTVPAPGSRTPTTSEQSVQNIPAIQSVSPDKTHIVILQMNQDSVPASGSAGINGIINTVILSDTQRKDIQTVFTAETGPSESFLLPVNSWSPDGKYFSVEYSVPDGLDVYIFQSNGERFVTGSQYEDIGKLALTQVNRVIGGNISWSGGHRLRFTGIMDISGKGRASYAIDVATQAIVQE